MDSTFESSAHVRGEEWRVRDLEGTPCIEWGGDSRQIVFFENWRQFEKFVEYATQKLAQLQEAEVHAVATLEESAQ